MTTPSANPHNRHARVFALLRQKQVGSTLAEHSAPARARYLDEATAMPLINSAVASLRAPGSVRAPVSGKPSLADIFDQRSIEG